MADETPHFKFLGVSKIRIECLDRARIVPDASGNHQILTGRKRFHDAGDVGVIGVTSVVADSHQIQCRFRILNPRTCDWMLI